MNTKQVGVHPVDGKPIYRDSMPEDPMGVINWEPGHEKLGRCGDHVMNHEGEHCCHRWFYFRAISIPDFTKLVAGGEMEFVPRIYTATVCNQCWLEREVVEHNNRQDLVDELMSWRGCNYETAVWDAWARWGYLRPSKKTEPAEEKRKVKTPYGD